MNNDDHPKEKSISLTRGDSNLNPILINEEEVEEQSSPSSTSLSSSSVEPPQVGTRFFVKRMREFIEERGSNPASPKSPSSNPSSLVSSPKSPTLSSPVRFNKMEKQMSASSPIVVASSPTTGESRNSSKVVLNNSSEKPLENCSNQNPLLMEEVLMAHSYEENHVVDLLNKNKPIEIDEETKSILNSKLPPLPAVIKRKTSNVARPLPRVPTTPSDQSEITRKTSFTKSPPTLPQKKHSSPVKEQHIEIKEDNKENQQINSQIPPSLVDTLGVVPPPPIVNNNSVPPTGLVGSVPPPPLLTSVIIVKKTNGLSKANITEKPKKEIKPVVNFMDEMRNRLSKINPQASVNEEPKLAEEKKEEKPTVILTPGIVPPPPILSVTIKKEQSIPVPPSSEPILANSITPSSPVLKSEETQISLLDNTLKENEEEEEFEDELVEEVLSPSSLIIPSVQELSPSNNCRTYTTPTTPTTLPKLQSTNRLSLSITSSRRSVSNNDNFMDETLTDLRLTEKLIDEAIQQVTMNVTKENVKSHRDCLMVEKVPLALDRILSNIMKANDYLRVRFDEIGDVLNDIGEQCNIISKEPQMEKRFYMNQNNKNRGSKMMESDVPFRKKSTIDLQSTDFSSEEHRQIFSKVAQIDLSFPSYYQVLKNVGTPLEFDEIELYTISDAVSTNHDSALYSPNYHSQQKRKSSNSTPYLNSGSLTTRSSRSLSSASSKESSSSFTNTPSESPVTVGLYNTQQ